MMVLVVGIGSIGRRHFENLWRLGFRDIAVVDPRPLWDAPQAAFLKKFNPPRYRRLADALADHPKAVFVTNPTSFHVPVGRAAVRAGAHVFIEKPISHTRARVAALLVEARRAKRILYVGYHFRHHPQLRFIKRFLGSGRLGRVLGARFVTGEWLPGWHPWEDYKKGYAARRDLGGGVVLAQSHDLDTAYWLFGRPRRVRADVRATGTLLIAVDDVAEMVFEMKHCPLVSIHLDYHARPPVKRLEIIGTKGRIEWDYYAKRLKIFEPNGRVRNVPLPRRFERNDMYISELREFLRAIRGRAHSYCDGLTGRTALEMCICAKESSRQKRVLPIRL